VEAIRENKILLMVACMFVLLDVLVWLNEILDLPYIVLGGPQTPFNWHEAAANTVMITTIGLFVVSILIHYISKRRQAEERIVHLNAVLHAVRGVNQLIIREKDCNSLLQKACDVLIEARGYDASWLGFLRDEKTFAKVVGSGFGEDVSRFIKHVMGGDHPPCIKKALAEKDMVVVVDKPKVCGDCFFESACIGKEAAIIRVEHAGRFLGLLAILFASDVTADEEEKGLLKEVAGDIGLGLNNMELEEAHKQADEALRESEERHRTLVESSTDAILMMDNERKIVSFNRAFIDLFGYDKNEVEGKSIRIIHQSDDSFRSFRDTIYPVIEKVGFFRGEWDFMRKDGTIFPVETVTSAIKSPNGSVKGYVDIIRDITERKQAEEERKKVQAQLQQSQKMEAISFR
jgi:PAS domain S-box-containing protein